MKTSPPLSILANPGWNIREISMNVKNAVLFLLASLSGNLHAQCIDLSGIWFCDGRVFLNISQSVNENNVPVYQFHVENGNTVQYIADNSTAVDGITAFCDSDRLRTVFTSPLHELHDNIRIVTDHSLSQNRQILQVHNATTQSEKSDIGSIDNKELNPYHDYSCLRI